MKLYNPYLTGSREQRNNYSLSFIQSELNITLLLHC